MIPDPSTIRLIHHHMIREELARHCKPEQQQPDEPEPTRARATALRHVTAQALRAVAHRIEPAHRPDHSFPAGPTAGDGASI